MLRFVAFVLIPIGFVAAVVSGSHEARRSFVAPTDRLSREPIPATTVSPYRPGEPSLILDDGARLVRGANGHFTTAVEVNGQPVEMVVDTGATAVALTVEDARRLGLVVDLTRFGVVGSGASGPIVGLTVTLSDVAVGARHEAGIEAVILAGLDRSLLGQSYLRRLDRVRIDGDTMTLR